MKKALAGATAGLLVAIPIHASQSDRFAYKFEMTSEEGPIDPAVQKRYAAEFDACQTHAVSTKANVACFGDEFARQDKALNRTWRATLASISPKVRTALVTAQRQWVANRDPFCKSRSAEFSGGTIAPVIYANCRVEQTIRRTIWLDRLTDAVPLNMQGIWGKHGRCDILADRLTITSHTAGWANGPFHRVIYDNDTISWDQEYVVDNFVIGRSPDNLVHNTQGFHMPGEQGYARCGPKLKRMTWPPR